jgi:hypothetical protein
MKACHGDPEEDAVDAAENEHAENEHVEDR